MATNITNENKNNLSISNENKSTDFKWENMNVSWADAGGTWGSPRIPIVKDTKNTLNISNESKP